MAMDFAEEDVLLALRQLPVEDAALDEDAAVFKRCKMKVRANPRAVTQALNQSRAVGDRSGALIRLHLLHRCWTG